MSPEPTKIAKTVRPRGNYTKPPWADHDYNRYSVESVGRLAAGAGMSVHKSFAFRPGYLRSMTYVLVKP